jgi:glycosyltransferase involved in cell wall biosynthesis
VTVLFLHNNCPGQFRHLAPALGRQRGNKVVFGTRRLDARPLDGVTRANYEPSRPAAPDTHGYVRSTEESVLVGQAVVRMADRLRRQGFRPDVVVAHSGWGPGLFVKEVFPEARLLTWIEWYYRGRGANLDFLPDETADADTALKVHTGNSSFLLDLAECDWAVTPTEYQASQLPAMFRRRLSVLHEGVDTAYFTPGSAPARGDRHCPGLRLPMLDLAPGTELVTYATRGMEPYRGFPQFLRAVDLLLRRRPRAHVVIAGEDRVAYGNRLPPGESWKQRMLAELDLDPGRVHFVGPLPYGQYRDLLRASSAHVYLTIPFVLSWSMLEAMATGCLLIGSATPPVQEIVEHGRNGLLVDFFDHEALAAQILDALQHAGGYAGLRQAARRTIVERYDLARLLPRQVELIGDLAAGRLPN